MSRQAIASIPGAGERHRCCQWWVWGAAPPLGVPVGWGDYCCPKSADGQCWARAGASGVFSSSASLTLPVSYAVPVSGCAYMLETRQGWGWMQLVAAAWMGINDTCVRSLWVAVRSMVLFSLSLFILQNSRWKTIKNWVLYAFWPHI